MILGGIKMMELVIRSFVMATVMTVVLTQTTSGREVVYRLGMSMLKRYTGFTRFTTVQIGNNSVQSVSFRDGSRYCIERDADGLIVVDYATGGMASIYNRCRRNLNTLVA